MKSHRFPVLVLLFLALAILGDVARAEPRRLLLVSQGPDGHPIGSHEYALGQRVLVELLKGLRDVEVTTSHVEDDWSEGPGLLERSDCVVLFVSEGGKWIDADDRRRQAFVALADRGGGLVGIHWALGCKEATSISTLTQLFGACHGGSDRKYVVTETTLTPKSAHAVTKGLKPWKVYDEFYFRLKRTELGGDLQPLLEIEIDGRPEMVSWAWTRPNRGRSFGFTGGHFHDRWLTPDYQRLLLQGIAWAAQVSLSDAPIAVARRPDELQWFRGVVSDAESGQPLPARIYLRSESGSWYFPKSADANGSSIAFQREYPQTRSIEMHSTISPHAFTLELPRGRYSLSAERGKEYAPHRIDFTIENGPVEVEIALERFVNMAERGWYSADTHLHRDLSDMPNLVLAEDLNVAFPMTYWVTSSTANPVRENRAKAPAGSAGVIRVDESHFVHSMSTEYEIFRVGERNHTLGAFLGIGHRTPIDKTTPPVKPIAEQIHAEGGLIDLEKHSWPWSISLVPLVQPDLYELANNHCWRTEFGFPQWTLDAVGDYMKLERNEAGLTEWGWIDFGFQTYYALLNCGRKLAPTAGSAAGVHPVPAGFGRVYVESSSPLDFAQWQRDLAAGRSFVTTGPLLISRVNGRKAGDTLQFDREQLQRAENTVRMAGEIYALAPIDRIEIVVNGKVVERFEPDSTERKQGRSSLSYSYHFERTLPIQSSGWMAVRVFESHPGGRVRFAHSAPWYLQVQGTEVAPAKDEMDYLLQRCRRELERSRELIGPAGTAEYEEALRYYEQIAERVPRDD